MIEDFPFEISPMFEGERIRKDGLHVELAGPKSKGFELVQAAKMSEVEDGKVTLIGPDINEMEEGKTYPYAMIYYIAGEHVETDIESIVERRNHDFQNYIHGYMHLNQRYDIWIRIGKEAMSKGLNSLKQIAQATMMLFKNELPFIERIEAVYITDLAEIEKRMEEAKKTYDLRDARTRDLHEEDVDTFYGCTLCQSFAPTNVCVITPDRVSLCGAINWFDGRAAAMTDPEGPQFAIKKGEVLDLVGGEYSGVNVLAAKLSNGAYNRIKLHSFFEHPHTSCGCFEVVGFFMPEVDGIGWVDRDFNGTAPNGLPFSTMAGQTGGGKQVVGFLGIGINYFRSPKFIQADGGWNRTVWMPKVLKDRVSGSIPQELIDAIATEEDVTNIDKLKAFLVKHKHPVVARWKDEKEVVTSKEVQAETPQAQTQDVLHLSGGTGGGLKIILSNAKITIDKIIVKKK